MERVYIFFIKKCVIKFIKSDKNHEGYLLLK